MRNVIYANQKTESLRAHARFDVTCIPVFVGASDVNQVFCRYINLQILLQGAARVECGGVAGPGHLQSLLHRLQPHLFHNQYVRRYEPQEEDRRWSVIDVH